MKCEFELSKAMFTRPYAHPPGKDGHAGKDAQMAGDRHARDVELAEALDDEEGKAKEHAPHLQSRLTRLDRLPMPQRPKPRRRHKHVRDAEPEDHLVGEHGDGECVTKMSQEKAAMEGKGEMPEVHSPPIAHRPETSGGGNNPRPAGGLRATTRCRRSNVISTASSAIGPESGAGGATDGTFFLFLW